MSSGPRKILLLCNAEHGQANVFLATSYALLQADPAVEIHLASFKPIAKHVQAMSDHAVSVNPQARAITFHEIRALDYMSAILQPEHRLREHFWLWPGFFTTPLVLWTMIRVAQPWNGPDFVSIFRETARIVEDVKPHVIAIDPILSPSITACRHLGLHFIVLSPNTIKDFAVPVQPHGAILWKYPIVGSSLPFPLPWYLVPLNVYYVLTLFLMTIFDFRGGRVRRYVKVETGAAVQTVLNLNLKPPPGLKEIVAIRPEIDFPMFVPKHIVPCGPILRPAPPVADVDPELAAWLARGPTVMINLGTHAETGEPGALRMALALRMMFDQSELREKKDKLQVLWKINKFQEFETTKPGCKTYEILGKQIDEDRVRIVDWVTAEPHSILLTGNVVCSVNHGGANSFLEALGSGVPQVVLPGWADCYDFAHRAEMLGVGRWGSRKAKPRFSTAELAPVLIDVVIGENAQAMRRRAKAIARLAADKGEGRDIAARVLLDEMQGA